MVDVELWGISRVLKIALKETTSRKAGRITIYLDIQMAIKQLRKTKSKIDQALRI